eukprot:PhF_6_TR27882/c0_g2_i2/m.40824
MMNILIFLVDLAYAPCRILSIAILVRPTSGLPSFTPSLLLVNTVSHLHSTSISISLSLSHSDSSDKLSSVPEDPTSSPFFCIFFFSCVFVVFDFLSVCIRMVLFGK